MSVTHNDLSTKQAVNAALRAIGENGLSGVVCEATSLAGALHTLLPAFSPFECDRVAAELHRQHLVEIHKTKKNFRLQPSVKAIHRLQRAALDYLSVTPQEHWDGLWRMVTYDVPLAKSKERRLFATQLKRLGFSMIRESVWLHPYPCFDVVRELARHCSLQRAITLAEIVTIDSATRARLAEAHPAIVQ